MALTDQSATVTEKVLPDYESIQINIENAKIKKDNTALKKLTLEVLSLQVNLYSGVVLNRMGEIKIVTLTKDNSRMNRKRPDSN